MDAYDLCITTDWEHDREFFDLLSLSLRVYGLSTFQVSPINLRETINKLREGSLAFRYLLDRASTTSPEFLELYETMSEGGIFPCLDDPRTMLWTADKATMHLEFLSRGIRIPHTIILNPHCSAREISLSIHDLESLGLPFIIKPASTTGGGIGVFKNGRSLEDIIRVRREYGDNMYLLQEKVTPFEIDTKRFWFRVFYICGLELATWWNDETHVYETLTDQQVSRYRLFPLYETLRQIADICKLNFFSTEIVVTAGWQFVVVDYVNEVCDLRLRSSFPDGVPNCVVYTITRRIAEHIVSELRGIT